MSLTMLVDTECSICGKKLGGKNMRQETRVGIFEPLMDSNGHVSHFAVYILGLRTGEKRNFILV